MSQDAPSGPAEGAGPGPGGAGFVRTLMSQGELLQRGPPCQAGHSPPAVVPREAQGRVPPAPRPLAIRPTQITDVILASGGHKTWGTEPSGLWQDQAACQPLPGAPSGTALSPQPPALLPAPSALTPASPGRGVCMGPEPGPPPAPPTAQSHTVYRRGSILFLFFKLRL